MPYALLADATVLVHFLWILFLLFGAFIGRHHRWIKRVHIAGLIFAITIQVFGWYCPLTYLEVWLRRLHGPGEGYSGSFLIHYIERLVYIELSPGMLFIMTVLLIMFSTAIYLYRPRAKSG